MPQPLSKMPQLKTRAFGVDASAARPKHMMEAMRIIAAAAYADQWLGNILVGLSPEKGVKLAKLYNGLEGDAKKASSFETTATAFLDDEMHDLLHLIVKAYKSAIKARNPFAHHRYGWAEEDDDILILVDPRDELLERAQRAELKAKYPGGGQVPQTFFDQLDGFAKQVENKTQCYRLAELEAIRRSIEEVTQSLTQFWQLTAMKPPPHVREEISAQLALRLRGKAT